MSKVTVVETSQCGQYSIKKISNSFYIYEGNKKLKGPNGNVAVTTNQKLAHIWLQDFAELGTGLDLTPDNKITWHFTYIDLFRVADKEELCEKFKFNFLRNGVRDCAFDSDLPECLYELAGGALIRKDQIKEWLFTCNNYQLCAITNIANFFHSANMAAMFALCLHKYEGQAQEEKLEQLFKFLTGKFGGMYYRLNYHQVFDMFKFYYNFEIPENQPKLLDIFEPYEKPYDSKIEKIIGRKFCPEILYGNNFYLYIDGKKSPNQPIEYTFPDIAINKPGKYIEKIDVEDNLKELLPHKCLVKHVFDRFGTNGYYIIYIELDETDSEIKDIGC